MKNCNDTLERTYANESQYAAERFMQESHRHGIFGHRVI